MDDQETERQHEIVPRKISFLDCAEDQISSGAKTGVIAVIENELNEKQNDIHLSISNDPLKNDFTLFKIYKNLFVLSISFVLMFTAYNGIVTLQSSLNTAGNVGVNSLIITYSFLIFSSIFLISILMEIFGLKYSIILAEIGYILYIAANIYPLPPLMYISAALVGLAAAPLWTAKATYLNKLAQYHAQHHKQAEEISVSLFFGIFFAFFGTNTIFGNLISYFVLKRSSNADKFNCGVDFDPKTAVKLNQTGSVDITTRYTLCGIFVGAGVLSMLLLFFTIDQIRLSKKQPLKQSLKKSLEVIISLTKWQHIDQLFLIPVTMWSTIETAFLTAQFTRGFVTCLAGIRYVGLIMVCAGVSQAISSYVFGRLVKYTSRLFCLIVAFVLNYGTIILMFLWKANPDQLFLLFIIAGIWNVADAIWQTQVIATYTVLYAESDPTVLAKYRLWKSVGFVVTYGYASYVTIRLSLILLLVYLTISLICYLILEIRIRLNKRPIVNPAPSIPLSEQK